MHERHLLAVVGADHALRTGLLVAEYRIDLGRVDGPQHRGQRAHERQEDDDRCAYDHAPIAQEHARHAASARGGRRFSDLGGQGLDAQ
jgi:hypothetical protein